MFFTFRYSMGTSFEKEASGAMLDLMGDDQNLNKKMNNSMKW